jgi:hypothetical protein
MPRGYPTAERATGRPAPRARGGDLLVADIVSGVVQNVRRTVRTRCPPTPGRQRKNGSEALSHLELWGQEGGEGRAGK